MAEYIEREALIKRLEVTPLFNPQYEYDELVRKGIIDLVKQRPAADVVEVRHGEWEVCSDEYEICAGEFVCSECKESFVSSELTDEQFFEMMKFCPNCGAKMDGKDGAE